MPGITPVLSGAGTFIATCGHQLFGPQSGIIAYPTSPIALAGFYRVTISTTDATIPTPNISDDDGSTFVPVAGQPANQLQWTVAVILARPNGGNRIHIVFPSAINKGTSPKITVEMFHPVGL